MATALTLYSRPIHVHVKAKQQVTLAPVCDTLQTRGQPFWLEAVFGPVTGLDSLVFTLNYSPAEYLSVPHADSVMLDPALMGNYLATYWLVADSALVHVNLKRIGAGVFSGTGSVVRFKLLAAANTPENTQARFSFTGAAGRDTSGVPFVISVRDTTARIIPPNRPPGAPELLWPAPGSFLSTGTVSFHVSVPPDSDRRSEEHTSELQSH